MSQFGKLGELLKEAGQRRTNGPTRERNKETRSKEESLPWEPTEEVALLGKRDHYLSLPGEVRSVLEIEGLPRLRAIRAMMAADAGLPMPLV
jgi:hypothetical protein